MVARRVFWYRGKVYRYFVEAYCGSPLRSAGKINSVTVTLARHKITERMPNLKQFSCYDMLIAVLNVVGRGSQFALCCK
jgi:hypothetical protein